MAVPLDAEDGHRPDYPPKTPPPPKRPVEPPRPEGATAASAVVVRPRLVARIANRRAANWTLENAPWTPAKAARHVVGKLAEWGYRLDAGKEAGITEVTVLLTRAALTDGGRRISLHLADQDHQALILLLSHQSGHTPEDGDLLREVTGRGVVSCGTDTDQEGSGRRRWALIDLGG
ncbi:hypothetical protein [Streptomyces violascens]|uniref:Regulatory protein n=1 Tax=Streptomyces violascens TaxID=67381 RepID=A0ABQ3QEW2_9ACTN|nr:hypothetical protein [Streptomyces violascens]GGU46750.1 hypothetical protein GCM10010289_79050 [Streptomyces violascens]GHI35823.1 hypothetical protein Sviol_02310 [Streptomyces violascens]